MITDKEKNRINNESYISGIKRNDRNKSENISNKENSMPLEIHAILSKYLTSNK